MKPAQRPDLLRDRRGVTIVEFAIVAPVFVTMLMFMFDIGYYFYAEAILGGEVQAAGRSSTTESATLDNQAIMDERVRRNVLRLVNNGSVNFTRMSYKSYGRAQAKAEAFTDSNSDGVCNNGEQFDDANSNGVRDTDSGMSGQGGAKDVTIYTARLEYDRVFPMTKLLGWNNRVTILSSTILRNQPFDKQAQPTLGNCT